MLLPRITRTTLHCYFTSSTCRFRRATTTPPPACAAAAAAVPPPPKHTTNAPCLFHPLALPLPAAPSPPPPALRGPALPRPPHNHTKATTALTSPFRATAFQSEEHPSELLSRR